MSKYFEIDKRQPRFRPINDSSMNILWLHHLLKHARLNKRDLYVCMIDVAKAFNSVPHQSTFSGKTVLTVIAFNMCWWKVLGHVVINGCGGDW
jgi:hypothetical protein